MENKIYLVQAISEVDGQHIVEVKPCVNENDAKALFKRLKERVFADGSHFSDFEEEDRENCTEHDTDTHFMIYDPDDSYSEEIEIIPTELYKSQKQRVEEATETYYKAYQSYRETLSKEMGNKEFNMRPTDGHDGFIALYDGEYEQTECTITKARESFTGSMMEFFVTKMGNDECNQWIDEVMFVNKVEDMIDHIIWEE